ncbi:hypothetical protein BTA51_26795 [Hahella sp. CCB-MM4]|uniref:DUF1326 domain-containing protein n=1 Tax=Hahella sp. (strain CCB-MM4) TaxID=1926491 RepID=UPI000B9B7EC6|nr:DUF1326 domain-containing protein [Hahella sp. CCB-MM4]OZG70326.1 hypothetical protein BTA51_26795 [Hahella sp. CCB-MM4]
MSSEIKYRIEGSYYEACNCDAICPCRRQNDVPGGLSSYGNCDFILSWAINKGQSGDTDLSGLAVCMAGSYHDDVEGSPWSVFIYIDERADDSQMQALSDIFQGKAQGNILFTSNISKVLGVNKARIELDHSEGTETIKIGDIAEVHVDSVVDFDGTVSCGIPGHEHPGRESVSSLSLSDAPFQWAYQERCGFSTVFAYWS